MTLASHDTVRPTSTKCRVLFADVEDERVARALRELSSSNDVDAILPSAMDATSLARLAMRLAERTGLPESAARRLLARPVNLALARLADGEADALVVGVGAHTADVLIACEMMLGRAHGIATASSAFVLDVPSLEGAPARRLLFADCAVNPSPTSEQLADIAIASADAAKHLLEAEPRVAMLSFSTYGSAVHPDVDRVRAATELARKRRPDLSIDGEIQADAALDGDVAKHKMADAKGVAGNANVLVFPDLDAANIAYKLVRSLAHARAYGAFLHGYGGKVAKLSRGATAAEIAATARLLAKDR